MPLVSQQPAGCSHEDLFLARYGALLRQARHLLGREAVREAEDLVHDAFVRFTVSRPPLHEVHNIDGYLVVLLRNLHASRQRHRSRNPIDMASVADFADADAMLRAGDLRSWVAARDTLRALCQYGCLRCRSSRAGSLFLLRFFHGFVPDEIARIARATPATVDEWIRRARREARAFLDDPAAVHFMTPRDGREAVPVPVFAPPARAIEPDDTAGFLLALRQAVFSLRHARCLGDGELAALYGAESTDGLPAKVLAEIVTCPMCLARVTRWLALDPPAARQAADVVPYTSRSARLPVPLRGRSAARAAVAIVLVWLLFFTPGLDASAATHVARAAAAIATRVWQVAFPPAAPIAPLSGRALPASTAGRAPAVATPAPARGRHAPATPIAIDPTMRFASAMQALAALQQRGAYLGQEVSLASTAGGVLTLDVLVDTRARRTLLRDQLVLFRGVPGLRAMVDTHDDRARTGRSAAVSAKAPAMPAVRRYDVTQERPAGFEPLSAYVRRTREEAVSGAALDAEVSALASHFVARSRLISQHAWALSHLSAAVAAESPATLASDEVSDALARVIRGHALALQAESVLLRREMREVLPDRGADGETSSATTDNAADRTDQDRHETDDRDVSDADENRGTAGAVAPGANGISGTNGGSGAHLTAGPNRRDGVAANRFAGMVEALSQANATQEEIVAALFVTRAQTAAPAPASNALARALARIEQAASHLQEIERVPQHQSRGLGSR